MVELHGCVEKPTTQRFLERRNRPGAPPKQSPEPSASNTLRTAEDTPSPTFQRSTRAEYNPM